MAAAVWLSSLDGNKIGDIHADRKEPEEFVVSRVDRPCAIVKANKLHLNCATRDSIVYRVPTAADLICIVSVLHAYVNRRRMNLRRSKVEEYSVSLLLLLQVLAREDSRVTD